MRVRALRNPFLFFLLVLASPSGFAEKPLAPATIVVFNKDVPESVELAKFYAQQRGIARDHLVPLSCSKTEEISRDEYDTMIRDPLRAVFKERKWWTLNEPRDGAITVKSNAIRFVAVMRGLPLKIRAAENYPGDKPGGPPIGNRNDASVDSEIAALGAFSDQISGPLPNPYFQSYRPIMDFENPALLLVCRLDAPQPSRRRRQAFGAGPISMERTIPPAASESATNGSSRCATSSARSASRLFLKIRRRFFRTAIP
jgi:uncharacterized protein (TIGR03790 family)